MYTKKSTLFFINVLFITLFSFVAHLAFAQDETGTGVKSEEVVAPEPRGERPQIVPNARALSAQMQTRITNLAANISNRMEAAVARLDAIVLRIESRTQKLKEEGYAVAAVLPLIDEAKTSLDAARAQLKDIDSHVHTTVTSENPRQEWGNLREVFTTVREHLKAARESLGHAVTEMKKGVEERNERGAVQNATEGAEVTSE